MIVHFGFAHQLSDATIFASAVVFAYVFPKIGQGIGGTKGAPEFSTLLVGGVGYDVTRERFSLNGFYPPPIAGNVYNIGKDVHFQLTLRDLESFKCPKMEFLLIDMENNAESVRTKDWPEYLNREYYYKMDGMNICINAFVKSDSPTCRKVVVGTDTVTTPKYQIECD